MTRREALAWIPAGTSAVAAAISGAELSGIVKHYDSSQANTPRQGQVPLRLDF